MNLFLIYSEDQIIVSKQHFANHTEIEALFPQCYAWVGAWSAEDVVQYLAEDYPTLYPSAQIQLSEFFDSDELNYVLTFASP